MVASLDLSVELAVLLAAAVVLASVLISPLATCLGAPILLLFLGVGMLSRSGRVSTTGADGELPGRA